MEFEEIFPWNDHFELGIAVLDEQHKELVHKLNVLAAHIIFESAGTGLDALYEDLLAYADFHFKTEDEVWQKSLHDHSVLSSHTEEHEAFVSNIIKLRDMEHSEQFIEKVLSYIARWLISHLLVGDKKLSQLVSAIHSGEPLAVAVANLEQERNVVDINLPGIMLEAYARLARTGAKLIFELKMRKLADERFKVLHRDQSAILDSDLIGVVKIRDRKIVWLNDYYEKLLGYKRDELIGQSTRMLFKNEECFNEFGAHAYPVVNKGEIYRAELEHVHKNGGTCWLLLSGVSLDKNANESLWLSVNIDERKRTEEALSKSQETFKTVVETLPLAVYASSGADQKCTYVNLSFIKLFGYVPSEVPTLDAWWQLAYPNKAHRDHIAEQWRHQAALAATQQVAVTPLDTVVTCKDGTRKSVSWKYIFAGNISYAFGADVTEHMRVTEELLNTANKLRIANTLIEEERYKLAERVSERTMQLEQANHAKDSFLATMSHEIRTPLAGLLGMMELLSLSKLDEKQADMLSAAQKSGNGLLRIVNDILDWSKIEAGKLELAPRTVAISDVLSNVINTYAKIATEKKLAVKLEIDSKLSATHSMDPLRLTQILNNFISNALKFTERGVITLSVSKLSRHEDIETIRFSVRDQGIGIAPEQQKRLFQQYEQASAETARMYGGTGLGLAICHRLAELMKGKLSVESVLGQGSIFSFVVDLPVVNQGEQKQNAQLDSQSPNEKNGASDIAPLLRNGQRISIIVVDDHPLNRMLIKLQLDVLGVQVAMAENGVEAFKVYQNALPDLIITDCHMPEMDGYELAAQIRQSEYQLASKRIPIIAWTANVLAEEADRCHTAGMDDLLTKPTELSTLRAMLIKWLQE